MKRLWPLLLLPFALLLIPPTAQAACTTPEVPVVGCPIPGASESPTPSPSPASTESPQAAPTVTTEPTVTAEPSPDVTATLIEPPPPAVVPESTFVVTGVLDSPKLPPPAVPIVTATPTAAAVSPLSGVVASSFALVVFGLLAAALLLSFLSGLRPAGATPSFGGIVMRDRTRLWTGLGVLAAAAVVGGVGWYRVSGEPLLNRQVPFLASAGILVVILSVLGGSLIIAEQLRGDQNRISELEEAVRALTEALAPSIEQPPRIAVPEPATEVLTSGRGRSRRAGAGST